MVDQDYHLPPLLVHHEDMERQQDFQRLLLAHHLLQDSGLHILVELHPFRALVKDRRRIVDDLLAHLVGEDKDQKKRPAEHALL